MYLQNKFKKWYTQVDTILEDVARKEQKRLRKERRYEDITSINLYEIRNYFTRGTRKREKEERKKDHVVKNSKDICLRTIKKKLL